MSTRTLASTFGALALVLPAVLLSTAAARAGETVRLEEHERNGYFDKWGRFGVFYGTLSGDRPAGPTSGPTIPTRGYTRNGFGVDFDMLGFWDATRFDTLLGAELRASFGSYSAAQLAGEPDSAAAKSYLTFRLDAASDYGLLHWDGSTKGRISGGAGFGFDLDGGKWYAPGGRAYPQLLARVQVLVGGLGLHGAYHWIPGTGGDHYVREHRIEGAAAWGSVQGGLRSIVTTVRPSDYQGDGGPLVSRELQAFVSYAF